ncbi:MAG TPA: redoxin domain-containing protein [Rubrobacteraceae bacterium]
MARTKTPTVPEVGGEAPEFHLPSAQGGQLRLSMRTARGPVVVAFYSGGWSEEDVAYLKDLASKEDEINLAAASVVGIGRGEPQAARDFVRETGIKSYVLYDYAGVATREYGLLEKDKEHGEYARPATFIVDSDQKVVHAWVGERPKAEEVLEKVSEITGLPRPAEEDGESAEEEKPKRRGKAAKGADDGEAGEDQAKEGKPTKPSPEEREKRRTERQAARSEGNDGESGSEE